MQRSKRLQPLIEIARLKARQGMQAVVYIQNRLDAEQEKLEQLLTCRAEYKNEGKAEEKLTVDSFSLQSLRHFRENVALAVEQQSGQVERVEAQLLQIRAHWRVLDARCQSLGKTQGRLLSAEHRQLDRIEQQETDELGVQSACRTPHNRAGFS